MADEPVDITDWWCAATPAGLIEHPSQLDAFQLEWIPARVPGTAASALRDAGLWSLDHPHDLDVDDWWFRAGFAAEADGQPRVLGFGGLATVADAWLNGEHILSSANMHRAYSVDVGARLAADNELVVRCAALRPLLAERRPRPRWKSGQVAHQNLRWFRTTLLGRMPGWMPLIAPVGPWRPVTLGRPPPVEVSGLRLRAVLDGDQGRVELSARLAAPGHDLLDVVLVVGGQRAQLECIIGADGPVYQGHVVVPGVRPWWPATHGDQPLYGVDIECHTIDGDHTVALGRTGFRSLSFGSPADPELVVNGVNVFCRGACWTPIDAISLTASEPQLRAALEQVRAAGMNMLRLSANTTYETTGFFDLCDELGILVWQDLMFSNMDYPADDPQFAAEVVNEVSAVLAGLAGRPCVVAICGGADVAQQAAMVGQPLSSPSIRLFHEVLPDLVQAQHPGTPFWSNTPIGGSRPFTVDVGLSHYFGVGAYRRPLADARLAGVRFALECLAFSHIPCDDAIDQLLVDGRAIHGPEWKGRVPRDAGAAWDTEDTRDHYIRELYGIDPAEVRIGDPDRYIDLGRAASAEVLARTFSEWRRPASPCHGALILSWRDLVDGAGVGITDSKGRTKSPYHPLRRVLSPTAILLCDEGLNGLDIWVLNDGEAAIEGTLVIQAFSDEVAIAKSETAHRIEPRAYLWLDAEELLGSFMDLTYAFRFGPPSVSAVSAHWYADGDLLARGVYHPSVGAMERSEIGLKGRANQVAEGVFQLEVGTRRLARSVMIDAPGCELTDDFFDIEPGGYVRLEARTPGRLRARVRALNGLAAVPVVVEEVDHGA